MTRSSSRGWSAATTSSWSTAAARLDPATLGARTSRSPATPRTCPGGGRRPRAAFVGHLAARLRPRHARRDRRRRARPARPGLVDCIATPFNGTATPAGRRGPQASSCTSRPARRAPPRRRRRPPAQGGGGRRGRRSVPARRPRRRPAPARDRDCGAHAADGPRGNVRLALSARRGAHAPPRDGHAPRPHRGPHRTVGAPLRRDARQEGDAAHLRAMRRTSSAAATTSRLS